MDPRRVDTKTSLVKGGAAGTGGGAGAGSGAGKRVPSQSAVKPQASERSIAKSAKSKVSVASTKAGEQANPNANKNALDALSRTHFPSPPIMEKRSGLQDVDEAFFKNNVYMKPFMANRSGLTEGNMMPAAGKPSTVTILHGNPNFSTPLAQTQPQSMEQQPQSQTQLSQPQAQSPGQPQAQAQAQGQTQPQAGVSQSQIQAQAQPQGQAKPPAPAGVPSQPQAHAQRQEGGGQQGGGDIQGMAEMYTTCPHCHTTIYLVPGSEGNQQAAGVPSTGATNQNNNATVN